MSSTPKVCHEETIYLPTWDENLCWFLSMNLALFHKPIPAFQNYAPDVTGDFQKDKKAEEFLQHILQHYSNPKKDKIQDETFYNEQIETLRGNENVAAFFNNADFNIDKAGSETAEEYLKGLQKTQLFHQYVTTISVGHDFLNVNAMNWDILMSIDLDKSPSLRKNGLTIEEYNIRDKADPKNPGKIINVKTEKPTTPLLILVQVTAGRGASQVADSETNILETITIPADFFWKIDPSTPADVKEKSKELNCSLISILENEKSFHYNCAVKCSDPGSSVWYFYGGGQGITGGGKSISQMDANDKKEITFASLDELLSHKEYSRLKKTSVLLVYEVVKPSSKSGGTSTGPRLGSSTDGTGPKITLPPDPTAGI